MTATAFKVFTIIIMVVVLFMHFSSFFSSFFFSYFFLLFILFYFTRRLFTYSPMYTYSEREFDLPFPTFLAINSLSTFGQ